MSSEIHQDSVPLNALHPGGMQSARIKWQKGEKRLKQILKRHFSIQNMNNYKRAAADFKRTIRRTRKKYWRDYCSALTAETAMNRIWKVFNSMKKRQPPDTYPLQSNVFLSAFEKAEVFSHHFAAIYNDTITIANEDLLSLHVQNAIEFNHNAYNIPFKLSELGSVIGGLPTNKAAGLDDIPYEFIRNLDPPAESFLLRIYNYCWSNSVFPESWKTAIILPFHKPGKDPSNPVSYRPISLLSTFGKVFERLVFNRLYWFLENSLKLPEFQAGFRKQRSTQDQLVRLEHFICRGIKEKQVVLTIYFDMSKAFDRVPHLAVLYKLSNMGVKGRMLGWIKNFLSNRTFQVNLLGEMSSANNLGIQGVPQGGILSPLLFIVFISDLPAFLDVSCSAFADDICLFTSANSMQQAILKMQRALNGFKVWADKWGLKINADKTSYQYFTRQRITQQVYLKYGTEDLNYSRVYKYLGLWFDSPYLTWRDHISNLTDSCKKRLNLMKACSSSSWGADRDTLLKIYKATILSKIQYGAVPLLVSP